MLCAPHFSTIYARQAPISPNPSTKCMQLNQSANICILIMWLLRLNSHHKFGLYLRNTFFTLRIRLKANPSDVIVSVAICVCECVGAYHTICILVHLPIRREFHIGMVSWRLPENNKKERKRNSDQI